MTQATLFDVYAHHVEPPTDPERPNTDECLRLIEQALQHNDPSWLSWFQHHLFKNCDRFTDSEYERLFLARESAAARLKEKAA